MNVEILKNILELNEEEFTEYNEMVDDLEQLQNHKNFYIGQLVSTYYDVVKEEKKLLFHERKYTRFVKKHYGILNTLVSENKSGLMTSFVALIHLDFDYVKQNYGNKDEIIKRLKKLLELNILEFDMLTEENCFYDVDSNERELFFEIDKFTHGEKKGLFTDGNITFKDDSGYFKENTPFKIEYHNSIHDIYPVEVNDANYVLRYSLSKFVFSDKIDCHVNMKIKNLMFDTDSLPTYEELQNGVFPKNVADYIADKELLMSQKQDVVDNVYEVETIEKTINSLLSKLENYTEKYEITKDLEEAKAIKAKLEVINELYNDVIALKNAVTNESFENELMDERELGKALQKKRWESIDSHCCC